MVVVVVVVVVVGEGQGEELHTTLTGSAGRRRGHLRLSWLAGGLCDAVHLC